MHDPKLIEAMALRFCLTRTLETQGRSELACQSACASCQTAMDAALCTARPDVAAVLRGEAVVVPRGDVAAIRTAWNRMVDRIDLTAEDFKTCLPGAGAIERAEHAASPYAAKETDDAR